MKLLFLLFIQTCFCIFGKPILPAIRAAVFGTKYFHEARQCDHCDARYYKPVPADEKPARHVELTAAYLSIMEELGHETWIAHGSLLGWWWQGSSMAFDLDNDVQVALETMDAMAAKHNYTTYTVPTRATGEARDYLLDINPNYRYRTLGAGGRMLPNIIDARFIDTDNGLYVDITALSPKNGDSDIIQCKTPHRYHKSQIYPLIATMFDGVSAYVPHEYKEILVEEYGSHSLVEEIHKDSVWVPDLHKWTPARDVPERMKVLLDERKKRREETRKVALEKLNSDRL